MEFSAPVTPFMPVPDRRFFSARGQVADFLASAEFFASGRDALARALSLVNAFERTVWVPAYFCPWVVKSVKAQAWQLAVYDDFPTFDTPDFATLAPTDGDIVVAVDFFGTRDISAWVRWKAEHKSSVLIGDFSHAPFSEGAKNPAFDFSFASLRKTLPVPDGGYLLGKNTPSKIYTKGGEGCDFAATYALAANLANLDYKSAQDFYYNAEMRLNAKKNISRISFGALNTIKMLDIEKMWRVRRENSGVLEALLNKTSRAALLKNEEKSSKDIFSTFCPTFALESETLRDKLYAELGRNGILASIYWGAKFMGNDAAKKVSNKMLTISLDFRHSTEDAENLANIINSVL